MKAHFEEGRDPEGTVETCKDGWVSHVHTTGRNVSFRFLYQTLYFNASGASSMTYKELFTAFGFLTLPVCC
jgi:hypothetical protein